MKKWQKIDRDLALSAGRPASDEKMHRAFLEANGLTEWAFVNTVADDVPYILNHGACPNGRRRRSPDGYSYPPCLDHGRLYRGLGLAVLVYHPYAYPEAIRGEVEAWGRAHGLDARVYDSDKSWYYPGNTALIVVATPGVGVVV